MDGQTDGRTDEGMNWFVVKVWKSDELGTSNFTFGQKFPNFVEVLSLLEWEDIRDPYLREKVDFSNFSS